MRVQPFVLDLAGITVAVEVAEPTWQPVLVARYAAFITAAPATWSVRLEHDPTLGVADWPEITHTEAVTRFRVLSYRGWIDLVRHEGTVAAPSTERAASAIERTLVYILMQMLPREHNGLLLHAAGMVWQGSGHVFFGPSGSGKTTMAQRAAGQVEVLGDENVVVRLSEQGPELLSTPFWGQSTPPDLIRRVNRRVPLRALYALEQTAEFSLQQLSAGQAVIALSLTEKVAAERTSSAAAWLAVAEHLVARVPVYRLGVALKPGLWEFLEVSTGKV